MICDIEDDDDDGDDGKATHGEPKMTRLMRFLTKVMIISDDKEDEKDANDDLSQGFPILLHPFWSPSPSQLLIPEYNNMSADCI